MTPVALADSVYLHFGTSSVSTGAATDADSTPTVVVAEDGVDLVYAPTVSNVTTGLYKVQIDATGANGFEVGKRYSAYVVATVGGITGRDGIGEFEVLTTALDTVSSRVDAAVSTRMATFTLPTNFSAFSITAGGLVDITQAAADKAWGTAARSLTVLDEDSTTIDLDATIRGAIGLAAANLDTQIAAVQSDTDNIQTRLPAALVSGRMDSSVGAMAADVLTAAATAADFGTELGTAVWATATRALTDKTGFGVSSLAADTITAASVAADAGTEIGTAVWASAARTLTALDEDNTTLDLDATIRSAVGLATANLDTQIGTLATAANLATVAGYLDTEIAAILSDTNAILIDTAEIGAAGAGLTAINLPDQTMNIVGNITGNLSGSVGSVTGAVGSVTGLTASDVGAIKAKTDGLTFTVAGKLDVNLLVVNGVTVTGAGTAGNPWGPA